MSDKPRILFVDDEGRVLKSMRGLFRREFELFLTTEGATAVKMVQENSVDVIVADQRMPGMTGIEVLGKVRELSPRTIRILLTGYADPSAVEGSINIGEVFRFLSKPCPPKLLRETLQLAIAAARETPPGVPARSAAVERKLPPAAEAASAPQFTKQPSVSVVRQRPKAPPQNRETHYPVAASTATKRPTDATSPGAPTPDIDSTSSHWQTVTEVILSGDTSEEIQTGETGMHSIANLKDVGVVVFTVDSSFAEATIRALSADRSTILATSLAKVAETIEQGDAGILVTDFTTNSGVLQKMISALKQQLPELVTLVVSGSRDTTDMISLINHGQVFRYILKPIDAQSLRNNINAAAVRHLQLLENPQLNRRHQVVDLDTQPDASATLNQFVSRIRKIRARSADPTGSSF